MLRSLVMLAIGLSVVPAVGGEFTLVPLDDFEDVRPWVKGDPNTDLTQREVAVAPSTRFVTQGRQSLAFMVRIDWTPRPGETYPQGWPMISRTFSPPQDWSGYDRLQFQLYTETRNVLPADRVLRCGVSHGDGRVRDDDWYTLPGIRANRWQLMSMPLGPDQDWSKVDALLFYIAEAWYHDGDRVGFYFDDLQLARRNWPVLQSCAASARVYPRGTAVELRVALEGPAPGSRLRCTIADLRGRTERELQEAVAQRQATLRLATPDLPAGGHVLTVALEDAKGKGRDTRRQFFTSLQPHRRTYLSLITFYTPALRDAKPEQLRVLNDSAYAAVAIPFWDGYDSKPVGDYETLRPALQRVRECLRIDPWPWVFSNHFIGVPADAQSHPSTKGVDLQGFRRINALDLRNEAGARADMLKRWRLAVRAAREWRVPGIVLDLEAYNDYRTNNVSFVAEKRRETAAQVIAEAESVGAELGRICAEEYPECVVWSLFSHLESRGRLAGHEGPVYSTAGHISLGFLKHARARHLRCRYLCGGETTPGYYNPNVAALKRKIAARDATMADLLGEFPDHFFLAGTIAPYHDYKLLTWWIKEAAGDDPELKTLEDFAPMFRTLFDAYDWVWVYAASAAQTAPYDPQNNRRYSDLLRAALLEARR